MLSLKKVYRDELLHIALILSLLRVNPDLHFQNDIYNVFTDFDLENGTSWRSFEPNTLRAHFIHPKSLDSILLNYERELFADLNSLGRYNRLNNNNNVTAYLLNVNRTNVPSTLVEEPVTSIVSAQSSHNEDINDSSQEENVENLDLGLELTQEVSYLFIPNDKYLLNICMYIYNS